MGPRQLGLYYLALGRGRTGVRLGLGLPLMIPLEMVRRLEGATMTIDMLFANKTLIPGRRRFGVCINITPRLEGGRSTSREGATAEAKCPDQLNQSHQNA